MIHQAIRLAIFCAISTLLSAQSYETQFSAVKFDRSKGPSTVSGGVEVEVATGRASMNIPLGPGIGGKGLAYQPALRGSLQPHAEGYFRPYGGAPIKVLKAEGEFQLFPGNFDLKVAGKSGAPTSWSMPDGSSGAPTTMAVQGLNTNSVLEAFGYPTGMQVASYPRLVGGAEKSLLLRGSNGELVIGLRHPTWLPESRVGAEGDEYGERLIPARILVVRGGTAYEYEFSVPMYGFDGVVGNDSLVVCSAHYRLSRILNRFAESIVFTYGANRLDHTAKWYRGRSAGDDGTDTGEHVTVALGSSPGTTDISGQAVPSLMYGTLKSAAQVRVTYQGATPAGGFTLSLGVALPTYDSEPLPRDLALNDAARFIGDDPFDPGGALAGQPRRDDWNTKDFFLRNLQPLSVASDATGETLNFTYAQGPSAQTVFSGTNVTIVPTVLKTVSSSNRRIELDWQPYAYRKNKSFGNQGVWTGYGQAGYPVSYNTFFWGVTSLRDIDTALVQTRTTGYNRTVPVPNTQGACWWTSTTFSVAVSNPDGSTTVSRFVEPLSGSAINDFTGVYSSSDADKIQTLAHLKHQVVETRQYAVGVDWNSGQPDVVQRKDRWDLRQPGNEAGNINQSAVPYPTRTRTWNTLTGIVTTEEMGDWDSTNHGWKTNHKQVATFSGLPSGLDAEYISLARSGQNPSYPVGSVQAYRRSDRTFQTDAANAWYGRGITEQETLVADYTGSVSTTLPYASPLTQKTFESSPLGRLTNLGQVTSEISTSLAFSYWGDSGTSASQMKDVILTSSPSLIHSGHVGVDLYGYDSLGHMNWITQKGMSVGQDSDAYGRPVSQSDVNRLATQYGWDGAGRLVSITPPNGEIGTGIVYHDDHRGTTVTRGAQKSEYRYDAYGALLLARRWDLAGSASHKIFSYDLAGRKTFESVWLANAGNESESFANTSLVGERWVYDSHGRVIRHTDANGIVTTTTYSGLSKTTTVGGLVSTTFVSDALGRLILVRDAKSQETQYFYDGAGRIAKVLQWSGAKGTEPHQERTWEYNKLGWLKALQQPESGRTEYSDFTVMGQPSQTTYGAGTNSPKILTSVFDVLGRPLQVRSANGDTSVVQDFFYDQDESGHGYSNGKLIKAIANGATRSLIYSGLNGRLSGLNRYVDGLTFTQALEYDDYGRLKSRTYPDGKKQTIEFNDAMDQPKTTDFGGSRLANMQYESTTWNLQTLAYANGASSAFTYEADRLATMTQTIPGRVSTVWSYGYDTLGRLTTDNENWYSYDPLGRLTEAYVRDLSGVATQGVRQQFNYDAFGNRTFSDAVIVTNWASPAPPTTPSVQPTPIDFSAINVAFNTNDPAFLQNRLPAFGNNGAPTGAQYDAQGNLTKVNKRPASSSPSVTLAYDALARVSSTYDSERGITEYYVHDDEGLRTVIRECQGTTVVKTRYNIYNEARQLVAQYEKAPGSGNDSSGNLWTIADSATLTVPSNGWVGKSVLLPCAPGDTFNGQLYASASGMTAGSAHIGIRFDSDTQTGVGWGQYLSDGTPTGTWTNVRTRLAITGTAPIGATKALIYIECGPCNVGAVANFDSITFTKNSSVVWKKDIVYVGAKEIAEVSSDGKTYVTLCDHLGTPRYIWDGVNAPVKQKFLPFGEQLTDPNNMAKVAKGFTNHEQTDASGMIYMQARFYLPQYGRFASPDPARDQHFEDTQSWNIYSYVQNNPVMSVDPTGMIGVGPDGNAVSGYWAMRLVSLLFSAGSSQPSQNNNLNSRTVYTDVHGTFSSADWQNTDNHGGGTSENDKSALGGYVISYKDDAGQRFGVAHAEPGSEGATEVNPGDPIGRYASPTNGFSSGPHAHLFLKDGKTPKDPSDHMHVKDQKVTTPWQQKDKLHPNPHGGVDVKSVPKPQPKPKQKKENAPKPKEKKPEEKL